jgi:hypothetical protein
MVAVVEVALESVRDVTDLFQSGLFQRLSGPSIGKPSKRSLQLFFMACYDAELMLFGFRFLKQVLFDENTIAMHQESAAKRMEQARAKLKQLEEEAQPNWPRTQMECMRMKSSNG